MDIISLGVATKAAMEEGKTRKQTLEVGVKGQHDNVAKRLDALEQAYSNSVKKANELIVKDAVNIMKAHARLNVIAQSKKYQMENMIFDDLLDLSGIDINKSTNYSHDALMGSVQATKQDNLLVVKTIETSMAPQRLMVATELNTVIKYEEVANQANFIPIGRLARLDKYLLTNGDASTYGWDDYPVDELQGFEMKYQTPILMSRVRIYGHDRYPMKGMRVTIDDVEVAYTTNDVKGWFEIVFNKMGSSIKIYRILGTHSIDQAISLVEVMKSPLSLTSYEASRDDGVTWQANDIDKLLVFEDKKAIKGTKLKIKFALPLERQLLNYGLTWT